MSFTAFLAPKGHIYLDFNATTPPAQRVVDNLVQSMAAWGNPSSIHWQGRGPKQILRESRKKISEMIGASHPLEIILTSGGSEANNLAIRGVFDYQTSKTEKRNKFLFGALEHPSVAKTVKSLESKGAEVHMIPVDQSGNVDMVKYMQLLDQNTALVSVMLASNETGTVFPVKKMTKLAHEVGALFHTDAVQSLGKMPVNVSHLGVDLATFSAHKFYALKGAGVLYSKRGTTLASQITGGGQERHRRAGTENILAISAFAEMKDELSNVEGHAKSMAALRDWMEAEIVRTISGIKVIAKDSKRLPNTSCFIIEGVGGETLLMNMDIEGFSVSTGSACSSGNPEPSRALLAMGITHKEAQSTLRVSLGWTTTKSQIESFVEVLTRVVIRLRQIASVEASGELSNGIN